MRVRLWFWASTAFANCSESWICLSIMCVIRFWFWATAWGTCENSCPRILSRSSVASAGSRSISARISWILLGIVMLMILFSG